MEHNYVYRVIAKVSYNEANFDFEDAEEAIRFAITAITHTSESEDCKEVGIILRRVDLNKKESEEE